ncbi:MAG: cyanophycin synthetase [Candidatus Gracilibacteria bacterium]|nr:cyanophycin synthetase [Candidatus Gracilibacteria bacterium]
MTPKHYHFIGIAGIGISALARYHHALGATITASDWQEDESIGLLRKDGIDTTIGVDENNLPTSADIVVYSQAHIHHPELLRAQSLGMKTLTYPEALAEVVNSKKCIAITGSHGKSTTTAMTGVMLAGSSIGGSTLVGTRVPQFGDSNIHIEDSSYFVIEACEYRRSFLAYHPYITVITNIDLDHLDYYHDLHDYISAFQVIVDQTSGYVIYDGSDVNAQKLDFSKTKAKPIRMSHEGWYDENGIFSVFSQMNLQVPGDHLLFDAKLAYVVGKTLGLADGYIVQKLESYVGSWRRSEIIRTTKAGNILMSDYGHHPTEIRLTLEAIKQKYADKQIFVAFQPHQYSRTRELLSDFLTAFDAVNELIIPDIYFSRDNNEDVAYMTRERFVESLREHYPFVQNGNGLKNTISIIQKYDQENPNSAVIVLLGAGDIDTLREEIW